MSFMTQQQAERTKSQVCGALAERTNLILSHMSLIYYTMQKLNLKLPRGMSQEDAVQYGCIGLIEAIDSFQEEKGKFSTFAYLHIRGAILDGIMLYQWMNRSQFRDMQRWQSAREKLEMQKGAPVLQEEVAYYLRLKPETGEVWQRLANTSIVYRDGLSDEDRLLFQEEAYEDDGWLEEREEKENLYRAISRLDEAERNLILEHYFHQKSLKDYAAENRISRNWACSLHKRALKKLKKWLSA